jgi:AcrR family transcriptional regulator
MSPITNAATRQYRSELREQHVEDTRARILDATVRVMAAGLASVTIPSVANEAGVSIPTIYRHFRTKRELLSAVYPHIERRAGLGDLVVPRTIDELRDGVRAIFARLESFDDLARAAIASPAAAEARSLSMPRRLALTRAMAASIEPKLAEADQDRIARLLVILTSSAALRTWRDHLDASVEEAADDIDWIVRAAVAQATHEDHGQGGTTRRRRTTKGQRGSGRP